MAEPASTAKTRGLNRKGRTRGVKNQHAQVKKDMLWVYKELGGKRQMLNWAKNPNNVEVFYRELLRLVPKELGLDTPVGNLRLIMDIDGDKEEKTDAEAANSGP